MNSLDILTKARDLIADPDNWTQGEEARDKYCFAVSPDSPEACRWCATGALLCVANSDPDILATSYKRALGRLTDCAHELMSGHRNPYQCPIISLNDKDGHEQIMLAFDRAIAKAKENSQ